MLYNNNNYYYYCCCCCYSLYGPHTKKAFLMGEIHSWLCNTMYCKITDLWGWCLFQRSSEQLGGGQSQIVQRTLFDISILLNPYFFCCRSRLGFFTFNFLMLYFVVVAVSLFVVLFCFWFLCVVLLCFLCVFLVVPVWYTVVVVILASWKLGIHWNTAGPMC